VKTCKVGPKFAKVNKVDVKLEEAKEELNKFEIRK
jgi:acylphosphatase